MATLEAIQKTMRTSLEVMVIKLGTWKGKGFRRFLQLFRQIIEEKPKELFERYKRLTLRRVYYPA